MNILIILSFITHLSSSTWDNVHCPGWAGRCGTDWSNADTKCGDCCNWYAQCPGAERCFASVSNSVCAQTPSPVTPAPVTPAPITPSPITTAPIPTTAAPIPTTAAPIPTTVPVTAAPIPTPVPVTQAPIPTASPVTPAPITAAPIPTTQAPIPTPVPVTTAPIPTTTAPIPTAVPVTQAPIPTAAPIPDPIGPMYPIPGCPWAAVTDRCGNSDTTGWMGAVETCTPCCRDRDDCTPYGYNECYGGTEPAFTQWGYANPCPDTPTPPPSPTPAPVTSAPIPTPPPSPTPAPVTSAPVPTPPAPAPGQIPAIFGCGTGRLASITFDDGPAVWGGETQHIIDAIQTLNANRNEKIVATFFVSPNSAGQGGSDTTCDIIGQLSADGHEVQSHSWDHLDFLTLTNAQMQYQLDTTSQFIVSCGGVAPTIFRPPYGSINRETAEYIVSLGYILALWNLDSDDWRTPNSYSSISANIDLNRYSGDSVTILMHDVHVAQIVEQVIDMFDDENYEYITQSECYAGCNTLDNFGGCRDMHGNNFWVPWY